jgi:7-carboxy-7-deazaguanine synthase
MDYLVNEIFTSLEGEGKDTGIATTFIRFFGCNLNCSYCDTKQKSTDMKKMNTKEILLELGQYYPKRISLTGGEPLVQNNIEKLIKQLYNNDYTINIQTNGTINIKPIILYMDTEFYNSERITFSMDYKSISSGNSERMCNKNLNLLREHDSLKFVVATQEDLNQVLQITEFNIKAQIVISPVWGVITPQEIIDFIFSNKLNARLSLQMHKIINIR